jgi:periplasmic divalent cation tolerance protein
VIFVAKSIMTDFVQIMTTTGTRQDAEQIASELVTRQLAACVQVSGPVGSTFRWQGRIETQEEWICTIKTVGARVTSVQQAIEEIHPYEVPEIIVTPIAGGSERYFDWLRSEVR